MSLRGGGGNVKIFPFFFHASDGERDVRVECHQQVGARRRPNTDPSEVVVEGVLKPDGTLELDAKPNLSPGRVQVTVNPLPPSAIPQQGLVEVMDAIRQSQQAPGYHGRTVSEMQAGEKTRREEDEDYERRCEQLWGGPLPPAKS